MKIGTKVKVNFVAVPTYSNNHRLWTRKIPTVKEGWYVGYTFKQEGKYNPGGINYYPDEHEQAFLSNIKAVKLLRIKFSDHSNDSFAYPEDVEVI